MRTETSGKKQHSPAGGAASMEQGRRTGLRSRRVLQENLWGLLMKWMGRESKISGWVNGCLLGHLLRRGHWETGFLLLFIGFACFVLGVESEEFCLDVLSVKCIRDMQAGMFSRQLGAEDWRLGREQGWRRTLGSSQEGGQVHPRSEACSRDSQTA